MKTKLGRPEMPKGKANSHLIHLRVSGEVEKEMGKAAVSSYQDKPEWMRDALKERAKNTPIWVKSRWKREDLRDKHVEFRLTGPTFRVEGIGSFLVRENPKGELAIEISVPRLIDAYTIRETRYWFGQEAADKIEPHPNPKIADFRLLA